MSIKYDLFNSPPRPGRENERTLHVRPVVTRTTTTDELAENISHYTAFSPGTIHGVLISLGEEIARCLVNSENIRLDGIGTFSLTLDGPTVQDPKEVRSEYVKVKRIVFRADPELKDKLSGASIQRVSKNRKLIRFTEEQRRTRILWYINRYQSINKRITRDLNHCANNIATRDLEYLITTGQISTVRLGRRTVYVLAR